MPWNAISRGEVFVIDDDAATRETLSTALREQGYDVISFADGPSLLSYTRTRIPVCIFVAVGRTDRSGFDLLRKLRSENCPAPIFVTSAEGTVPMAVDAIRSGAFDFITKPVCGSEIAVRVDAALDQFSQSAISDSATELPLYIPGGEPLTSREREVLARLTIGETNKQIARHLGLSARTVEGYRAAIMRKAGARNATELLRRVFRQGRHP
jgi:two-component system, LuxR family, response regulator FixJ